MKNYKQFESLVIEAFESAAWQHPVHRHNHYELIFIQSGEGTHYINGIALPYAADDVFLIGPGEEHFFEIASSTKFVFIKFTDKIIHQVNPGSSYGLQQLEYLMKSRETHLSGFQIDPADVKPVRHLLETILSLSTDMFANEKLIWLQVMAIAVLLQRNMPELKAGEHRSRDIQAVFCYLHKYIYSPDQLRSAVMAAQFNTTADYIGPYFKRNTGITIRDYIRSYRKKLIAHRVAGGGYSLKQIAAEFGLTDESHVSRLLKD